MRTRKSIDEHALTGTRPQYVLPDSDLPAGRPKCPKSLSPDARKVFKRLTKMLQQRRVCTAGDQEILRLYSTAFDRHQRAIEHLAAEGEIVIIERVTKSGAVISCAEENLWLSIAVNAEKYMRGVLSDLGLTPIQRSRVKQTESPKKPDDEIPSRSETVLPEPEINLEDIHEEEITFDEPTGENHDHEGTEEGV
jgi:P27 family predicted phage terminase small subunit